MNAVDLFAGAGGFTLGAERAGCTVLWAANHWPAAVAIHKSNHPNTTHACQDLQQCDWTMVPRHDLLIASPACGGHSPARGADTPHHDKLRATSWAVVSAVECKRPYGFVVENVPAFVRWQLFPAWRLAMESLGYSLSQYVLDAADYGVPQHRVRVFVVGTKSRAPVALRFRAGRQRIPISSVIDFNAGTWATIRRDGRSERTLARVKAGRATFGARFVMPYYGSGSGETGRSIDRPIGTITTRDRWAVVDGSRMRMLMRDEVRAAMAFPARYRLPDQHRQAVFMLGDAVPPPLGCAVIRALKAAA